MKKISIILFVLLFTVLPFVSFAQNPTAVGSDCSGMNGLEMALCRVGFLINAVIPVLIALGVAYFVWGVVQYVIGADDDAKTKGRDKMIWGLIGLTVIVSIWGLVTILKNTLGIDDKNSEVSIPCIPGVGIVCPQRQPPQ